jgi:DNA-binding SARP family transcriptional activator/transcriptional regulator with XRE-family HTH domain
MMEDSGLTFGAILQAQRHGAQLTQKRLAELAGISLAAVRDLEQGRRRMPRRISVKHLAAALRLDDIQLGELIQAARHSPGTGAGNGGSSPALLPALAIGQVWLQILGPVTAWRNGRQVDLGSPMQRAVLAFLAFRPGALVHRESIIDALWDGPPVSAVNLVQGCVSRLRRTLEPTRSLRDRGGSLVTMGASYQLNLTASELDLLSFRYLVDMARTAYEHAEFGMASNLYAQAIGLWHGEPITDIDRCRSHPAVAGLNRERFDAVLRYADCCDELGQESRALPHLWSLTVSDPLYEPAHARLITALARSGDQASALRVFESLRRRLDNELGVYPGAEVANAYAQVLR